MQKDNLKNLITSENSFFSKYKIENSSLSESDKIKFRNETVLERRQRISSEVFNRLSGQVKFGHFQGLKLDPHAAWGKMDYCSMLLGTYEKEIIDEIHNESHTDKKILVELGAADGFYAIGTVFNKRFIQAYCFEMTENGRNTIARNAELNAVANQITIHGYADSNFYSNLTDTNWSDVFILCDVEGAEFEIFDDDCLKAIRGSTIVIEIHHWIKDFWIKYEKLIRTAGQYFSIHTLTRTHMSFPDCPELYDMHDDNRALMLSEGRPNVMRYLLLTNKS